MVLFFFPRRRRHTRVKCDWSSDVCSSDLLVSVTGNPLLPPTFTLPKLRLVGLAPSKNVAATPVPLRARVRGEPGALLASDTEPVTLPAAVGENAALNDALAPGASVSGAVRPVLLKPERETVA